MNWLDPGAAWFPFVAFPLFGLLLTVAGNVAERRGKRMPSQGGAESQKASGLEVADETFRATEIVEDPRSEGEHGAAEVRVRADVHLVPIHRGEVHRPSVVLVEEDLETRAASLLAQMELLDEFGFIGVVPSEELQRLPAMSPDVVVMDVRRPTLPGLGDAAIRRLVPDAAILLVSTPESDPITEIGAGASGLLEPDEFDQFPVAIRSVVRDRFWITSHVAEELLDRAVRYTTLDESRALDRRGTRGPAVRSSEQSHPRHRSTPGHLRG
jgi:DNA-binding NarL/FixJ family response regulator